MCDNLFILTKNHWKGRNSKNMKVDKDLLSLENRIEKNPHILNVYFWMAFNIMSGVLLHGHQTNNEQ